jgi:hypothetical protein
MIVTHAARRWGARVALSLSALAIAPPLHAGDGVTTQVWGNYTLGWTSSDKSYIELDVEPKVLVSGDPKWRNADVTGVVEYYPSGWIDLVGELTAGRTVQDDDLRTIEATLRAGVRFQFVRNLQDKLHQERRPLGRIAFSTLFRLEQRNFWYSDDSPSEHEARAPAAGVQGSAQPRQSDGRPDVLFPRRWRSLRAVRRRHLRAIREQSPPPPRSGVSGRCPASLRPPVHSRSRAEHHRGRTPGHDPGVRPPLPATLLTGPGGGSALESSPPSRAGKEWSVPDSIDISSIPRWRRVIYAILPLLLLAGLELVIRVVRAPLWFGSFRELRLNLARRGFPAQTHPILGYVPAPTEKPDDNLWGTRVTIDAGGFRSNGRPNAGTAIDADGTARTILAVGDSFTFGDQVNDDETWPAYLEAMVDRPVLNGGVFGYSLDQIVLRAEEILASRRAGDLIVSIFPDDIDRCEYSTRYAPKPYFDIVAGQLVLNPPGERGPRSPADERMRRLKNLLGHSALLDALFSATVKYWWYKEERSTRVHPPGEGLTIARLLVERIDALCRERGCRLLIVSQGPRRTDSTTELLRYADRRGIRTLDLIDRVNDLAEADPGIVARFFDGHMTPAGNRWVAEEVAAVLARDAGRVK